MPSSGLSLDLNKTRQSIFYMIHNHTSASTHSNTYRPISSFVAVYKQEKSGWWGYAKEQLLLRVPTRLPLTITRGHKFLEALKSHWLLGISALLEKSPQVTDTDCPQSSHFTFLSWPFIVLENHLSFDYGFAVSRIVAAAQHNSYDSSIWWHQTTCLFSVML